ANGIDDRPVVPHRERKSVGIEKTFLKDIDTTDEMLTELGDLEEGLWKRIKKHNVFGKTITLKVKYNDFEQITRSLTFLSPLKNQKELHAVVRDLLKIANPRKPVRLLGISISNFEEKERPKEVQLTINFD
ncbi:MAG: polymerase, partial [Anaerophaga sp.]|nr:polymerase [Anaerophaga sp.]